MLLSITNLPFAQNPQFAPSMGPSLVCARCSSSSQEEASLPPCEYYWLLFQQLMNYKSDCTNYCESFFCTCSYIEIHSFQKKSEQNWTKILGFLVTSVCHGLFAPFLFLFPPWLSLVLLLVDVQKAEPWAREAWDRWSYSVSGCPSGCMERIVHWIDDAIDHNPVVSHTWFLQRLPTRTWTQMAPRSFLLEHMALIHKASITSKSHSKAEHLK